MVFRDDLYGNIDVVFVAEVVGDLASFILRLRVGAADDAFEFGPALIVHDGVVEDDQADASLKQREETLLLFIGDVLDHLVKHDDIEVVKERFVISVGSILGVSDVGEARQVRILGKHFEERLFLEAMTARDDEDFGFRCRKSSDIGRESGSYGAEQREEKGFHMEGIAENSIGGKIASCTVWTGELP